VSRYVGLLGEELAPFTVLYQFLGVRDCGWSVKTCSESLPDQCFGSGVVATGPGVYVIQKPDAVILGYAFQQYFLTCFLMHKFAINQYVILRSPNKALVPRFILKSQTV